MFIRMLFVLVMSYALCWAEASFFVLTTKENSTIYRNETRTLFEEPLFTVERNTTLKVISMKGDKYSVVDAAGRTGWIEKNLCARAPHGTTFEFQAINVRGYSDNPLFFNINAANGSDDMPVHLDRSFKDEMKRNVDKETVARQVN